MRDFLDFVKDGNLALAEVTAQHATDYANHLRTLEIAVDTHNRKIRRLRRIFAALEEYYTGENPFTAAGLQRKAREEQNGHRRVGFTKEQEQQLLDELEKGKHKLKNKHEIRVLFYIGMFTGQWLKDCALLQWHSVDLARRRIWVKQFKTGKKVTVYGFHSLRHSFASHCAEAGVPKAVARSILGADSDIIDKYYVHIGEEAQLKTIRPRTVALIEKILKPFVEEGVIGVAEGRDVVTNLRHVAKTGEQMAPVKPKLINQAEAAEMLGIGLSNFKKLEKAGGLPGLPRRMVGSAVRYRNTDVIRFIMADNQPGPSARQ